MKKHYYFRILRINCSVFVCFYVYRNSCGYHRKNACAAHENSQDTVNCLEYEKLHGYLTKMQMFLKVLSRAREHSKYRRIISAKKTRENTRLWYKCTFVCTQSLRASLSQCCALDSHRFPETCLQPTRHWANLLDKLCLCLTLAALWQAFSCKQFYTSAVGTSMAK